MAENIETFYPLWTLLRGYFLRFYGVRQSKRWEIICQENEYVDPELSKGVFVLEGGGTFKFGNFNYE